MKKKILHHFLVLTVVLPGFCRGQDTVSIGEVKVISYLGKQLLLKTPAAAAIIDSIQLKLQATNSLLPALNTVPGVRMEERSPGSYRLSLRGSLLRSPFGVRNVKVYLNQFPLTDAGGNTYINLLAMSSIDKIEVLKGPDGSLFGANSGGVINIHTFTGKEKLSADLTGGSYGLYKGSIAFARAMGKHNPSFVQSYQQAVGYRENSKMRRVYLQGGDTWRYSKRNSLEALVFYSDLFYQTPGGLTRQQYDADREQARPATATLPGALTQKAAVYNKTFFSGITHDAVINNSIQHVASVFFSTVNFKNPFITNYEERKENTYGIRTFFIFRNDQRSNAVMKWEFNLGAEWQQTRSSISNYANNKGDKGLLMAEGNIRSSQHFIFGRFRSSIGERLIIEAGLSLNYYRYRFKDSSQLSNRFKPQWMPRLALAYTMNNAFTLRTSVSKGYSPPTTAEIRPSDNNIYKDLQAETGMNIEFGIRYFGVQKRFWADLSVYNYRLRNAIVRQQNSSGAEYFVNAGGTRQTGIELQGSYMIISPVQTSKAISKLQVNSSGTYSHFKFSNYVTGASDYSGNNITGVPTYVFVNSVLLEIRSGAYLFIQHNYTSEIPLNDASTVLADHYNLVQLKLGFPFYLRKTNRLEVYAGIDNLLNTRYSLGNDLNAAGNRFFNAAPLRNYFAGVRFSK
jgi:iron complex outermembrane recepter protein